MEAPNGFSKIAEGRDKSADGTMELPHLELSLKSLRSAGDGGTATHDDRNVLRRSDLSAFSRYHTSATSNQATTGYGGSCSSLDNSSEAVKTESTYNMISNSNAAPLKQGSNGGSDNNDMGSTTKNVFSKPVAYKEKTASTSAVKRIQTSAFHHPMQFRSSGTQQVIQEKVDGGTAAASIGQPGEIQCQVQVQHHDHHHHLIHRIQSRSHQIMMTYRSRIWQQQLHNVGHLICLLGQWKVNLQIIAIMGAIQAVIMGAMGRMEV